MSSHGLSSVHVREEGRRERRAEYASILVSLLVRTLIQLDQGPTLMTSCNLNYFLTGSHLQIQPHWGLGLPHMNEGDAHILFIKYRKRDEVSN